MNAFIGTVAEEGLTGVLSTLGSQNHQENGESFSLTNLDCTDACKDSESGSSPTGSVSCSESPNTSCTESDSSITTPTSSENNGKSEESVDPTICSAFTCGDSHISVIPATPCNTPINDRCTPMNSSSGHDFCTELETENAHTPIVQVSFVNVEQAVVSLPNPIVVSQMRCDAPPFDPFSCSIDFSKLTDMTAMADTTTQYFDATGESPTGEFPTGESPTETGTVPDLNDSSQAANEVLTDGHSPKLDSVNINKAGPKLPSPLANGIKNFNLATDFAHWSQPTVSPFFYPTKTPEGYYGDPVVMDAISVPDHSVPAFSSVAIISTDNLAQVSTSQLPVDCGENNVTLDYTTTSLDNSSFALVTGTAYTHSHVLTEEKDMAFVQDSTSAQSSNSMTSLPSPVSLTNTENGNLRLVTTVSSTSSLSVAETIPYSSPPTPSRKSGVLSEGDSTLMQIVQEITDQVIVAAVRDTTNTFESNTVPMEISATDSQPGIRHDTPAFIPKKPVDSPNPVSDPTVSSGALSGSLEREEASETRASFTPQTQESFKVRTQDAEGTQEDVSEQIIPTGSGSGNTVSQDVQAEITHGKKGVSKDFRGDIEKQKASSASSLALSSASSLATSLGNVPQETHGVVSRLAQTWMLQFVKDQLLLSACPALSARLTDNAAVDVKAARIGFEMIVDVTQLSFSVEHLSPMLQNALVPTEKEIETALTIEFTTIMRPLAEPPKGKRRAMGTQTIKPTNEACAYYREVLLKMAVFALAMCSRVAPTTLISAEEVESQPQSVLTRADLEACKVALIAKLRPRLYLSEEDRLKVDEQVRSRGLKLLRETLVTTTGVAVISRSFAHNATEGAVLHLAELLTQYEAWVVSKMSLLIGAGFSHNGVLPLNCIRNLLLSPLSPTQRRELVREFQTMRRLRSTDSELAPLWQQILRDHEDSKRSVSTAITNVKRLLTAVSEYAWRENGSVHLTAESLFRGLQTDCCLNVLSRIVDWHPSDQVDMLAEIMFGNLTFIAPLNEAVKGETVKLINAIETAFETNSSTKRRRVGKDEDRPSKRLHRTAKEHNAEDEAEVDGEDSSDDEEDEEDENEGGEIESWIDDGDSLSLATEDPFFDDSEDSEEDDEDYLDSDVSESDSESESYLESESESESHSKTKKFVKSSASTSASASASGRGKTKSAAKSTDAAKGNEKAQTKSKPQKKAPQIIDDETPWTKAPIEDQTPIRGNRSLKGDLTDDDENASWSGNLDSASVLSSSAPKKARGRNSKAKPSLEESSQPSKASSPSPTKPKTTRKPATATKPGPKPKTAAKPPPLPKRGGETIAEVSSQTSLNVPKRRSIAVS